MGRVAKLWLVYLSQDSSHPENVTTYKEDNNLTLNWICRFSRDGITTKAIQCYCLLARQNMWIGQKRGNITDHVK